MRNLRRIVSTTCVVMTLLAATGCSHPVLDYRNAEVSDGLIYASGANEPFTGSVTHVPDSFMINGEGHAKFMKEVEGDRYAVARFMQAVLGDGTPTFLCTVAVSKGYVDGAATCYRPQSDTKIIEAHFVGGQLSGTLIYYNPQKPGQKLAEGGFDGGQPDGLQEIYSTSSGELVKKVAWSKGLYDGKYVRYNESNGKVVLKGAFVQGHRDGTWDVFTADGKQRIARAAYKEGNLDGVEEDFDADTGKRTVLVDRWVDGKISGARKTWDKDGVPVGDEIYADGALVERKDVSAKAESGTDPLPPELMKALSEPVAVASASQPAAAGSAPASRSQVSPADMDACVSDWVAAHRKVVGEDAMIAADQLDEWRQWCVEGKHAPK
jgi:antitoxin component YwqK of YwqJK toxin-antitoxin module